MKIIFNKQEFLKEAQCNYIAPNFSKLKNGELGDWLIAILFVPIFGWFWYPIVAISSTRIKLFKTRSKMKFFLKKRK